MRQAVILILTLAIATGLSAQHRRPPNYNLIEKGVWLGGRAEEPPEGVTAVLNVCELKDIYRTEHYLWKPIDDRHHAATLKYLEETLAFIDEHRKAGRSVFVHCDQGISRAPTVMAAYLMVSKGWTRRQALGHLREARPLVRPNQGFMDLLFFWEQKLKQDAKGKTSNGG